MKKLKTLSISVLISLCSLTISNTGFSKSSVWKASKNDNEIYIGGTVHVLAADDYPLPCEFDQAYSKADVLFFETDIKSLKDPKVAFQLIERGTYPFGEEMDQKLSKQTLSLLTEYLDSIGLPSAGLMKYKPGLLMSFITAAELNKIGINIEGVDQYYESLASKDNKPIYYFEEIEEQIGFLESLGVGTEEKFIQYLIESMQNLEYQFITMRETWRNGEIESMSEAAELDKIRAEFPDFYQTLFTERNEKWLVEIDRLIKSKEIEYILVGAGHLPEKEGLLARLNSKGYQIEQLSCDSK